MPVLDMVVNETLVTTLLLYFGCTANAHVIRHGPQN
jgi:hypothetical protein